MQQLKVEAESIQISIYCDVILDILCKHKKNKCEQDACFCILNQKKIDLYLIIYITGILHKMLYINVFLFLPEITLNFVIILNLSLKPFTFLKQTD